MMDQFVLQRAEETLHDSVVVTVSSPTHAGHDPETGANMGSGIRIDLLGGVG